MVVDIFFKLPDSVFLFWSLAKFFSIISFVFFQVSISKIASAPVIKYNDEFSIQLKELISNYEVKITDLHSTANKITDAFQELEKRIDKHDNVDASAKSAEDILTQSQEVLKILFLINLEVLL